MLFLVIYIIGGIMGIGFKEILVILLIVLILFGGKKLPELAKGLGVAFREFKKATKEIETAEKDIEKDIFEDKE